MAVISLAAIRKELLLACRQLGCAVSETLASLIAATIVSAASGGFYVENPIDEVDARTVVEEAAKKILSKEEPGISCLRLQAAYESSFAEIEQRSQKERAEAAGAEHKALAYISGFEVKFTEDFEVLTGLYKKIYQLLLLRCTKPWGVSVHQKDENVEREVAAALESVFPRVGLRAFVALTGPEKTAQLQELSGIVLGIRLFNQHQGKGGAGLPALDETVASLGSEELLQSVQQEVEEVTELCKAHADVALTSKNPPSGGPWEKPLSDVQLEQLMSNLLYHRQYLCYLLNLQEDLAASIDRLRNDQGSLREELLDLDALVGGRVSVPKEQVYPRFDALARAYGTAFQEVKALEARQKLHTVLRELRGEYFPPLAPAAWDLLERVRAARLDGKATHGEEDGEEPVDLDAIPGPGSSDEELGAVRLTAENSSNFMALPLDFQGFCVHALVVHGGLLVPGNPALGVVRYAGRFCVFATERGLAEFCAEPDRFFGGVREACYKNPELIHLLRIHEDFPKSSLAAIVQQQAAGGQAPTQADVSTETPLHFEESHIDKNYEWNEWALRKEALHMADIRNKSTSATQTALSHLRRENETQVYLPKDQTTNTVVNNGTNPPRWKKYHTGMRGEPQPMKVVEVKFDL